jgi:SAM-dependent methyltransferase
VSAGLTGGPRPGTARSDNEAKYRSRNPVVRRLVARFLARVGDLVEAQRPRGVLEVGCGEGAVIESLAGRLPAVRFHGVELDPAALRRGRARCPAVSFLQADACALPFPARSYDLVLCLEVLEHLPEPERALRELRRVARHGCLVSVPHEPYFRLGNALRGRHLGRLGNPSDHVQHWGSRDFAAFCARELAVRTVTRSFPWLLVHGTV